MSGLEIAAGIATIIGGLATAIKFVIELRDRRKKQKEIAAETARLNELEASLRQLEKNLRTEYSRLGLTADDVPQNSLAPCEPMISAVLDILAAGTAGAASPTLPIDLVAVQTESEKCAAKALEILQALAAQAGRSVGVGGTPYQHPLFNVSALSGATLVPGALGVPQRRRGEAQVTGDRAEKVCRAALRYANNECGVEDVLKEVEAGKVWECREEECGSRFKQMSILLEDRQQSVWIGPTGWFKAHVKNGNGYVCIWERRAAGGCEGMFVGRKELLSHLVGEHVRRVGRGIMEVEEPADLRSRGPGKVECGVKVCGM